MKKLDNYNINHNFMDKSYKLLLIGSFTAISS